MPDEDIVEPTGALVVPFGERVRPVTGSTIEPSEFTIEPAGVPVGAS